jgi:hypothetical protein
LFPENDGIRPLPFSSPFINPTDVTAYIQEEDPNDAPPKADAEGFDKLSKKDY